MAQTIEQMNSPEVKEQQAPTGPVTVDERVLARRAIVRSGRLERRLRHLR